MRSGIITLWQYPEDELFRLIVDGSLLIRENGWQQYEARQPGCLKAVLDAMAFAFIDLTNIFITPELVTKIHELCMTHVNNTDLDNTKPGEFRSKQRGHDVGFQLTSETTTLAGLIEILDMIENEKFPDKEGSRLVFWDFVNDKPDNNRTAIQNTTIKKIREQYKASNNSELATKLWEEVKQNNYFYKAPNSIHVTTQFNLIIDEYKQAILEAKDDQEKSLSIIVDCIQKLERLHPFKDANIRTFVIVLLNQLLIQNGFCPVTLENPNQIEGHSREEFLQKIKVGMHNTQALIHGESNLGFDAAKSINKAQRKQFVIMCNQFKETISIHVQAIFKETPLADVKKILLDIKKFIEEFDWHTNKKIKLFGRPNKPDHVDEQLKQLKLAIKNNDDPYKTLFMIFKIGHDAAQQQSTSRDPATQQYYEVFLDLDLSQIKEKLSNIHSSNQSALPAKHNYRIA